MRRPKKAEAALEQLTKQDYSNVNFPEVWHELYAMGAQIVFWVCALSVSVVYLNQAFLCVCKCAIVECLIGV